MKKMIIASAAIMLAIASQAASFTWSCTGSKTTGTLYGVDGTKLSSGLTAYLFCATDIAQADLLAGARDAENVASYIATKSITDANGSVNTSSKISETAQFSYGSAGTPYDFYFAIVDGDNMLISSTVSASGPETGFSAVAFGSSASSFTKVNNADASFGSAGWYSTAAAVPEPTSGLLLLLGMAGLALRRKQA